jgi:hypothetical protein
MNMREFWAFKLPTLAITIPFNLQLCIFGVCIPLDIVLPGILGALYYIGIDFRRFFAGAWVGRKDRDSSESPEWSAIDEPSDAASKATSAPKKEE